MKPIFSLIVPTYNDSQELKPLLDSFFSQWKTNWEILLVNDASSSEHSQSLEQFISNRRGARALHLPSHQGRFRARVEGANQATGTYLVFSDSRVELPSETLQRLASLLPQHHCLMANIGIDSRQSIYSLYWKRSHEWFFKDHFSAAKDLVKITPDTYESHLKGTTFLACERSTFQKACSVFENNPPENDDTPLLLEICRLQPIVINPDLAVSWRPRQHLIPFLARLWNRAPGFVEYYFSQDKNALHRWLWASFLVTNLGIATAIVRPSLLAFLGLLFLLIMGVQSLRMSHTIYEAAKILPLHAASVLSFGLGVFAATWKRILLRKA